MLTSGKCPSMVTLSYIVGIFLSKRYLRPWVDMRDGLMTAMSIIFHIFSCFILWKYYMSIFTWSTDVFNIFWQDTKCNNCFYEHGFVFLSNTIFQHQSSTPLGTQLLLHHSTNGQLPPMIVHSCRSPVALFNQSGGSHVYYILYGLATSLLVLYKSLVTGWLSFLHLSFRKSPMSSWNYKERNKIWHSSTRF